MQKESEENIKSKNCNWSIWSENVCCITHETIIVTGIFDILVLSSTITNDSVLTLNLLYTVYQVLQLKINDKLLFWSVEYEIKCINIWTRYGNTH